MARRTTLGPSGTILVPRVTLEATLRASFLTGATRVDEARLPGEGEVVGGRYLLKELLGEGQFGRVYRAVRTDMPEHAVALKVLAREVYAGRDPERELRLLSAVAHPHVVQLADHGVEPDHVWFTMPFYKGKPLDARLESAPLTPREAFETFAPIAEGLEALHSVGLRHQDIKPENVFLATFHGQSFPLVLDLGAAAPVRAVAPIAGTLIYAAPEQARAILGCLEGQPPEAPLTEAVDVYALAATLLRALVGETLFPGGDADATGEIPEARLRLEHAFAERERAPLRPSALPGLRGPARLLLEQAMRRWMATDPLKRPSMRSMRAELSVLLAGEEQAKRARARQRASLAVASALSLVALVGYGYKRQKDRSLGLCTAALTSVQNDAIARVSSLHECKDLLSHQTASAQVCRADLEAERQLRLTRGDSSAEQRAFTARLERCEASRSRAVGECEEARDDAKKRADDLDRELGQVRRERDELASALASARAAQPPASSASAPLPPAAPPAPLPGARLPVPAGSSVSLPPALSSAVAALSALLPPPPAPPRASAPSVPPAAPAPPAASAPVHVLVTGAGAKTGG